VKRKPTKQEALIGGLSLAITIALCVFIIYHRSYLDQIAEWGYIGCFVTNVLTSGTFAVPGLGMILRGLFQDSTNSLYIRFSNMLHTHGSKAVFLMACIINPMYYPFAVFMGMLHFRFAKFFLATWAGRTIKNMILAYLGYFGLRSILQWLGLSF